MNDSHQLIDGRAHLAPRQPLMHLYNAPLLVENSYAIWLRQMAGMNARPRIEASSDDEAMAIGLTPWAREDRKPYELNNGVAIIQVRGFLEHDSHLYYRWWTGYDAIRQRFDHALADADVKAIALRINSGGGMVSGNFDLSDHIYHHRGDKPIVAIVDEHAYSAAYSLASAADRIVVARTGGTGSIGAVAVLANFAALYEKAGIAVEVIRSGDRKMKPNGMEAFEQEDLDRIQAGIDDSANLFINTVARNRNLDPDDLRAMQAATFRADESLQHGLADAVKSADAALNELFTELSGSPTTGVHSMTQQAAQPEAGAKTGTIDLAAHDQAIYQARTDATTAERDRIFAILNCEEAKGREDVALALAKNPAMTAESAKEVLAATSPAQTTASNDLLDDAMRQTGGGPGISGGTEEFGRQEDQVATIDTQGIYDRRNQARTH